MIGDFCIVENALVRLDPIAFQNRPGERRVAGVAQRLQRALHGAGVILRQGARVGARVGEDLVFFVKCLRQA